MKKRSDEDIFSIEKAWRWAAKVRIPTEIRDLVSPHRQRWVFFFNVSLMDGLTFEKVFCLFCARRKNVFSLRKDRKWELLFFVALSRSRRRWTLSLEKLWKNPLWLFCWKKKMKKHSTWGVRSQGWNLKELTVREYP